MNLIDWKPLAPVRMYHCSGDSDVLFENSRRALESFQAQGADTVELVDPAPLADHGGCVEPSFLAAKAWFDTFRL